MAQIIDGKMISTMIKDECRNKAEALIQFEIPDTILQSIFPHDDRDKMLLFQIKGIQFSPSASGRIRHAQIQHNVLLRQLLDEKIHGGLADSRFPCKRNPRRLPEP